MNQYQRMICYLYEYNRAQKGANVGYVRLEQRGERCRVQIQMRGRNLETPPIAAFFKQEKTGVHLLRIGEMQKGKGELYCRVESSINNLLDKNHTLEEMDGIFLYVSDALYFASSWKLQEIFVGSPTWWEQDGEGEKGTREESGGAENDAVVSQDSVTEEWEAEEQKAEEKPKELETAEALPMPEEASDNTVEYTMRETEQEIASARTVPQARGVFDGRDLSVSEMEAQTVCERCPFKRKGLDYGKRMLLTFPVMKPFGENFFGNCVRIEPQDLGCLPMKLWPLSGNVFLMQGYYNYRHLIFMERNKGKYAIGVPGIYSDVMQEQGRAAGFPEFMAICGQKNCRGAFGYWVMPLSGKYV